MEVDIRTYWSGFLKQNGYLFTGISTYRALSVNAFDSVDWKNILGYTYVYGYRQLTLTKLNLFPSKSKGEAHGMNAKRYVEKVQYELQNG